MAKEDSKAGKKAEEGGLNKGMTQMKLEKAPSSPSIGGNVWSPSGNNGLKIGKQLG